MRVWMAPYTLVAKRSLSSKARGRERVGALLRIEEGGALGYADLHPWPELGDSPLKDQIKTLADGGTTPLLSRSLSLAMLDLEARSMHESAFADLVIPPSHYLVTDLVEGFSDEQAQAVWNQRFRTVKAKVGRDPAAEAERLNSLVGAGFEFEIRLDLNASMSFEGARAFLSDLALEVRARIEFIEDPCKWNREQWAHLEHETNLPLALDRVSDDELIQLEVEVASAAYKWIVIKPAIQDPARFMRLAERSSAWTCVTSYLDHPVGQMGAALEAARLVSSSSFSSDSDSGSALGRVGDCGLVSHHVYEVNEFSEALVTDGPRLSTPAGTGIGFDAILARQTWERVR